MADFITNCGFVPTAGGTTDWTYSSAVGGYQSPVNAQAVNGSLYVVRAQSADLTQWEYAVGAYSSTGAGTFARTTVLYNSSATGTKQGGAGTKINFTTAPAIVAVVALAEELLPSNVAIPCGRLTLTSGTPITTADVTAATNVYYTPYNGNIITLYDGAIWVPVKFTEITLALTGLTANTNYDVWGRINSGALALDTTAWTNATTRATAIAQQDGVDVKSGDATRRLLGTIRITGTTGQCEDSIARRYVSNRYNDVPRPMQVNDPASTWAYSTATWRQANGNTANQLDYVCCVARLVQAIVSAAVVTTVTCNVSVGIGIDVVPTASSGSMFITANAIASSGSLPTTAYYAGTPGVGRHFLTWIEIGWGTGTQTWIGTNLPATLSGIVGTVNG
ncbi:MULTISPECIES: hypothetical protein [unclassified Bradyrhizobium]|uniref:hypothetical protein n=1 Tax=unclassified Bradyrhizobium TaxID=2631580 RepID=UPI0028E71F37|nr:MULTISPECIES: hypothetical protein [unclassified Bradyrhizobium]